MTAWLLSVVGAGIIGVLVEQLTSRTRLHKVIKTACTYVFLLVLIFPLPSLVQNGVDMESCGISGSEITYDEDILDVTDGAYFSLVASALGSAIAAEGYDADCEVTGSASGDTVIVDGVTITLRGEFTDSSAAVLRVKSLAADYLGIEQPKVQVILG